ncbi:MAG: TolC family protein, partial [Bryobacteraceae bacterium]
EDLEKMALAHHPALAHAAAGVRAAEGRALQAGLYPNPTVGANGDEIARGPVIRGGEFGGFFEQRVVTAGKLGLSRRVAQQAKVESEAAAGGERQRVLNAVRALYYQALGDQKLIEVRTSLAKLARRAADVSRELANVGQADRPDVLAIDIEAQRLELNLVMARNAQQRTWRQLAAAVNQPSLSIAPLAGDLESPPKLDMTQALAAIYKENPELIMAQAAVSRMNLAVDRARIEKIPDVQVRGGVRYNRELLEQGPLGASRAVGVEGFFDIGVQIPIFNRNQGALAAARAESEQGRLAVDRARLLLRSRFAAVSKEYDDAIAAAGLYRREMLPKAKEAYDLYQGNFRRMSAAYPQVLIAQRNWFQLQEDYVAVLVRAWQSAVEIQGLLVE